MKIIVTVPHQSKYPDPISLQPGDKPELGRISEEPHWPDWIWAEHHGKIGWVPMQVLNKEGIVTEAYSAYEHTVQGGEELHVGRIQNGWYWAQNLADETWGWLPIECAKRIID